MISSADRGRGGPGRTSGSSRGATCSARGIHGVLMVGSWVRGDSLVLTVGGGWDGDFATQSLYSFATQSILVKGTPRELRVLSPWLGRRPSAGARPGAPEEQRALAGVARQRGRALEL